MLFHFILLGSMSYVIHKGATMDKATQSMQSLITLLLHYHSGATAKLHQKMQADWLMTL